MDEPLLFFFEGDGAVPNNRLPLLVYPQGLPAGDDDKAAAFERLFAGNGWPESWRNGIFPYHHFHSTSHEVLGIARGRATVLFGGERGEVLDVEAGDVVVIPAGVGHKRLECSNDLLVVGAYPDGQDWDLREGDPDEYEDVTANVAAVAMPSQDPVRGREGPLRELWR
ncbi:MAG: cupin domain-containing protein [Pseudomonadota bacterium]